MKCRKCTQRAAINMRHHKLALCPRHYIEWFITTTQRIITKYQMLSPDQHILVAVSGGKDSLALWDILITLGYQVDGLYIDVGIDGGANYSNQSYAKVRQFVDERPGLKLTVVDVNQSYGMNIPQLAVNRMRGRGKPCAACGLTKRHIMNSVACEGGYAVLATGHNLDDEAAVLLQNTLHWQTGYLARQTPVLPSTHPRLARKVKPLFRFYEREMAAYAIIRGINYIYDECPYAVGNLTNFYKTLLNQLEAESPGTKLSYYLSFLKAKEEGLFAIANERFVLNDCIECGQPTTAPGLCAFCRQWGSEQAKA
jgi:tRNA-5-methyluridine54 2-sulfurtransferase